MNNPWNGESGMIRLLTAGVRAALVAAAMAAAVPMIAFAQTTEPTIESAPAPAKPTAANASPTSDKNGADKGRSVQTNAPAKPATPAPSEADTQRRFNELRRELLDDRADTIDWWLVAITIVLGFLAFVSVVLGYVGFRQFQKIEAEAKNSVEAVTKLAEDAKRHVEEIERNRDRSAEVVRGMSAQNAADDPEEAEQAVANVRQNPKASLMDKAIARAVSLQQQGRRDEAIEKWRAVAHVAEESDNDLAARAWFSVGYLVQDESPEAGISAYDRAIRLKPDLAEAYNNRGNTKARGWGNTRPPSPIRTRQSA